VVVSAALVILERLGVGFEGSVPLINVKVPDHIVFPYVLTAVLAYSLVRLTIEWAQSPPERRRQLASRLDFGITLALGGTAAWILAVQILPPIKLSPAPLGSATALIVVGIATGALIDTVLSSLPLIRSKEEARRLALPRVPVAIRASLRLAYVVIPALVLVLLLSPSFSSPMSHLWPWLLCTPVLLLLLTGAISLGTQRHTRPDGTVISRADYIKGLRSALDRHDAHYQVGGWDTPIPSADSPLYQAAQRGDVDTVRLLLNAGGNPDELNTHGWTPLMIAVAQQHLDTARLLLAKGGNPNLENLLGRNALMFAARYGNEELVRALLDHGANPNLNNSDDPGALGAAAANGHLGVVALLLKAGADPSLRDRDGKLARDYAEANRHGEVAALLRRTMLTRDDNP
jgi:hypothetical protein